MIVTGAGRGIGREFALEFARRGASVVVNDLGVAVSGKDPDERVAQAVVDEIRAKGGSAVGSGHSVATPEGGAAIDRFGRLDALVNNASLTGNVPFEDLTVAQYNAMIAVNLQRAFNVTAHDVAANFNEISATDPYYVPSSVAEESAELCSRHGIRFSVPS